MSRLEVHIYDCINVWVITKCDMASFSGLVCMCCLHCTCMQLCLHIWMLIAALNAECLFLTCGESVPLFTLYHSLYERKFTLQQILCKLTNVCQNPSKNGNERARKSLHTVLCMKALVKKYAEIWEIVNRAHYALSHSVNGKCAWVLLCRFLDYRQNDCKLW